MSDLTAKSSAVQTYSVHDSFEPDAELQRLLEAAWSQRHDAGSGFRYRLHIERERVIGGQFGFLLQLNRQRMTERRQPQSFQLATPFDPTKFHFALVDPCEVLLELRLHAATYAEDTNAKHIPVSLLINNSPLTLYHSLVVPQREMRWPQTLTPDCLRTALELLLRLPDRRYRIAFNSPGALASVNHLHMHLVLVHRDLYVQSATLLPVKGSQLLYRLADHVPAQGFCYVLRDRTELDIVCSGLYRLVLTLMDRQLAHNVFFTWTNLEEGSPSAIRALVYPRVQQCTNKMACSFNAAALEMSGYVSVGAPDDFDNLTEQGIVSALREAQGDVSRELRDVVFES